MVYACILLFHIMKLSENIMFVCENIKLVKNNTFNVLTF